MRIKIINGKEILSNPIVTNHLYDADDILMLPMIKKVSKVIIKFKTIM